MSVISCLCFTCDGLASQTDGGTSEGFTTTYNDDFKPISERHPWLKLRRKAKPVPAVISPLQHFYNATNSTYGSTVSSQSPFRSLLPALFASFGVPNPFPGVVGDVGSFLNKAGKQAADAVREKRVWFGTEDEANKPKEQESKDEPQWKIDVHYEEGVVVLPPCVCLTCCDDCLKSLHGEVRSLNLPAASTSFATLLYNKDAGNGEKSAHLWDLSPAAGRQSSSVLQPAFSLQCSHRAWETKRPARCAEMQTNPPHICQSSARPLACAQPTNYCSRSTWKLPLSEYQANFSAEWAMPKIQQIYHRICPCHRNPRPLH